MASPTSAQILNTPVLFVVFNRPDTSRVVFEAIRAVRPPRLYVAADGPRPHVLNETEKCELTRTIVKQVDWPCDVFTLFRNTNLGCGKALSSAISWFFSREEQGIILEDDCLPSKSFFWYCEELLNRYKDDFRIMHIGGNNFVHRSLPKKQSYYFSRCGHIWGWATWARAWNKYDFELRHYLSLVRQGYFNNYFLNLAEKYYRLRKFNQIIAAKLDTWDYQWDFARFTHSGLAVVPAVNLVKNIGYGLDATHTTDANHNYGKLENAELSFPLNHPPHVLRDFESDKKYFKNLLAERIKSKLIHGK